MENKKQTIKDVLLTLEPRDKVMLLVRSYSKTFKTIRADRHHLFGGSVSDVRVDMRATCEEMLADFTIHDVEVQDTYFNIPFESTIIVVEERSFYA